MPLTRKIFDDTHQSIREAFRTFVEREVSPHHERWEMAGRVDKTMFRAAGVAGFLGMAAPSEFGGGDASDFRLNAVIAEEIQRAGVGGSGMCITLHNNVCLPYLLGAGTPEQLARWLPGVCSGETMLALAMTEPSAGSDLGAMATVAVRNGDHYVVNGAKTFISSALNCDTIILAVKTDASKRHHGISLLVVDASSEGLSRGKPFAKIGLKSQDTSELFFDNVSVPVANLLGAEGSGFQQLVEKLPQERLGIAIASVAASKRAFDLTLEYCRERRAFNQPIGSFQSNRFTLAELRTEIDLAQVFVDRQIEAHIEGELTAEDAAEAKWWCTELQQRVVAAGVQLHGGSGFMADTSIARAFLDARVQTIYGGTTQIMKEIIGRSLGI